MPQSQVCLLAQCNSIIHASWVHLLRYMCLLKRFSIRQDFGSVTNPGWVLLPRICKTCQHLIWTPPWIYQILSDAWIISLGCYKDDVCYSRISKIGILNANPWSLSVAGKIFLHFFLINRHFGGHLVRILILYFIWWLDSNFIANNLRKKLVWDIFPHHTIFHV